MPALLESGPNGDLSSTRFHDERLNWCRYRTRSCLDRPRAQPRHLPVRAPRVLRARDLAAPPGPAGTPTSSTRAKRLIPHNTVGRRARGRRFYSGGLISLHLSNRDLGRHKLTALKSQRLLLRSYTAPDSVLSVLHTLSHLILTASLWGIQYFRENRHGVLKVSGSNLQLRVTEY